MGETIPAEVMMPAAFRTPARRSRDTRAETGFIDQVINEIRMIAIEPSIRKGHVHSLSAETQTLDIIGPDHWNQLIQVPASTFVEIDAQDSCRLAYQTR